MKRKFFSALKFGGQFRWGSRNWSALNLALVVAIPNTLSERSPDNTHRTVSNVQVLFSIHKVYTFSNKKTFLQRVKWWRKKKNVVRRLWNSSLLIKTAVSVFLFNISFQFFLAAIRKKNRALLNVLLLFIEMALKPHSVTSQRQASLQDKYANFKWTKKEKLEKCGLRKKILSFD